MSMIGFPTNYEEVIVSCVTKAYVEGADLDEAIHVCETLIHENRSVIFRTDNAFVNQMLQSPIRSVDGSTYRAYGVLFGSAEERDLYNTYFTRDTEYYLDWYESRPWLYHHGRNPQLAAERTSRIGTWRSADIDDKGVFLEGELDRRHKYVEEIDTLIAAEILFPSSGSLQYMVRIDDDGFVKEWPIVEVSSTVSPGEWRIAAIQPAAQRAYETLTLNTKNPGGSILMTSLADRIRASLSRRAAATDADVEGDVVVVDEVVEGVVASVVVPLVEGGRSVDSDVVPVVPVVAVIPDVAAVEEVKDINPEDVRKLIEAGRRK